MSGGVEMMGLKYALWAWHSNDSNQEPNQACRMIVLRRGDIKISLNAFIFIYLFKTVKKRFNETMYTFNKPLLCIVIVNNVITLHPLEF